MKPDEIIKRLVQSVIFEHLDPCYEDARAAAKALTAAEALCSSFRITLNIEREPQPALGVPDEEEATQCPR